MILSRGLRLLKKASVPAYLWLTGLFLIALGPSASTLANDKQPFQLTAQGPRPFAAAKVKQKQKVRRPAPIRIVCAVRTISPITIDGRLVEAVWQTVPNEGFTQTCPNDGDPATERTKVWVAYDDEALYVAAMCYYTEHEKIKARLGRRDDKLNSDWFFFAVDPYYDKRSAYTFGVTPAGSIIDGTFSNDIYEDDTWDGVWESQAVKTAEGWSLEMKIPLNQIRFPKKDEHVWGVNFQRVIERKGETANFIPMPQDESAYVSRFALLKGIKGISPGRHIEFMPYDVGEARFQPAEAGNPFQTGHRTDRDAGFDLKLGLKSNLTLDATVNPDFGEVEVDPALINLTAYETYYDEKRPLFIEGASIFSGFGQGGLSLNANVNWSQPSFFYSRRIGRPPEGPVTQNGFVDFPDRTSIIGAAKATGQFGAWNLGFIEAFTSREYAAIDNEGGRSSAEVEPFSSFSVFRAQKDINKGFQGYGLIVTGVVRDLRTENLSSILNKNAFSLAFDGWSFLDKNRDWVVSGWVGGTRVEGTAEDITWLQRSSLHYYQRPDAFRLNPEATSLSGWGTCVDLAKQNGSVLFVLQAGALSPGFDPNDIGFQNSGSDIVNLTGIVGYRWTKTEKTKTEKIFQNVLVAAGYAQNYDFGWNRVGENVFTVFQGTLRNFWQFQSWSFFRPATLNNQLTRGGPMAFSPSSWEEDFNLTTDSRRPIVLNGSVTIFSQHIDGHLWNAQLTASFELAPNITLAIGPRVGFQTTKTQWVKEQADPLMTLTSGYRYVFGQLDQKTVSAVIRLTWAFTSKLSLQAYLQPFNGVGKYSQFKELARPRVYKYNLYGESGSTIDYADGEYTVDPDGSGPALAFSFPNPDFNVKPLRGTVVFRWEYLPGSLIYFVWTQSPSNDTNPGILQQSGALNLPNQNTFLLKVSYRWNI